MRKQVVDRLRALASALAIVLLAVGCTSGQQELDPPRADISSLPANESAVFEYISLEHLADNASAIVLVTATDNTRLEPLPNSGPSAASTPYVAVVVDQVLSGEVAGATGAPGQSDTEQPRAIEVVNPNDPDSRGSVIVPGRSYILFITPAMYAAEQPAGGYAVVGATQGIYERGDREFSLVDSTNTLLPESIDIATQTWPTISKSEQELLALGPR